MSRPLLQILPSRKPSLLNVNSCLIYIMAIPVMERIFVGSDLNEIQLALNKHKNLADLCALRKAAWAGKNSEGLATRDCWAAKRFPFSVSQAIAS